MKPKKRKTVIVSEDEEQQSPSRSALPVSSKKKKKKSRAVDLSEVEHLPAPSGTTASKIFSIVPDDNVEGGNEEFVDVTQAKKTKKDKRKSLAKETEGSKPSKKKRKSKVSDDVPENIIVSPPDSDARGPAPILNNNTESPTVDLSPLKPTKSSSKRRKANVLADSESDQASFEPADADADDHEPEFLYKQKSLKEYQVKNASKSQHDNSPLHSETEAPIEISKQSKSRKSMPTHIEHAEVCNQ
jgi:hypothetical protein